MAQFLDAAIPFLGGVLALLIGFRILGKPAGVDPRYDKWHERAAPVLKISGLVLLLVSVVYLVIELSRH